MSLKEITVKSFLKMGVAAASVLYIIYYLIVNRSDFIAGFLDAAQKG